MFLWLQSKHGLEEEKMDYLSMRLHTFESENERLKTESLRLKTENEKLKLVHFSYTMHLHWFSYTMHPHLGLLKSHHTHYTEIFSSLTKSISNNLFYLRTNLLCPILYGSAKGLRCTVNLCKQATLKKTKKWFSRLIIA